MPSLTISSESLFSGHQLGKELIAQRPKNGYINVTALCKAEKKLFADYSRLTTTKDFLMELSTDMGIPISVLIQTLKEGNQPKSNIPGFIHKWLFIIVYFRRNSLLVGEYIHRLA